MSSIPKTMRSLVAPTFCNPDKYEIAEMPVPSIEKPNEILIKVHAASIATGDTQMAKGMFKLLGKFP